MTTRKKALLATLFVAACTLGQLGFAREKPAAGRVQPTVGSQLTAADRHGTSSANTHPARPAATHAEAPVADPAAGQALMAQLTQRFEAEPRDDDWAQASEADLSDALIAKLTPESELEDIVCKASLCRVQTRHEASPWAKHYWQSAVGDHASSWPGAIAVNVSETHDDGRVEVTAFFTRSIDGLTDPAAHQRAAED